jgi:FolB domain-containing protein
VKDRVFLRGLECRCLIGVDAEERLGLRPLRIDVEIDTDCREAGHSDEITAALDYRAVAERVKAVCAASSFRLLEALAESLAMIILGEFAGAEAVRVRIVKPGAVVGVAEAGVEIERRWGDLA